MKRLPLLLKNTLTKLAFFEDLLVLLVVENLVLQLLILSVGGRVGGSPAVDVEDTPDSIVALVQLDELVAGS